MYEFINWLGHASFRIDFSRIIYIDPWKLKTPTPADIILISHPHYDHFSKDDIDKIYTPNTIIITVKDVAEKLEGYNIKIIKPNQTITIDNLSFTATRAYNKNKDYHPKKNDWVGFIISSESFRIYYAGDTDIINEMENIHDVDVALLPIGGEYTMNPTEASEVVSLIEPKAVLPYHYGDIVGSKDDLNEFKRLTLENYPNIIVID